MVLGTVLHAVSPACATLKLKELTTCSLSVVHSWQALAGLRLLIGCGEALNQAAGLYLTFFYKRNQLASRGAFYFGVFALAGSMNGLLAYAILKYLNGARGWLAWRWLFLIEGAITSLPYNARTISKTLLGLMSVFVGFFVFFLLPHNPEKLGKAFTAAEKEIATRRYREAYNVQNDTKIRGSQIVKVLKSPVAWIYGKV